jgi:hypothetical protein
MAPNPLGANVLKVHKHEKRYMHMTTAISPAQEARLGELARDFEIALAIPVAKFGGETGRKTQLDRIATDIISVFSGSKATFANDAPQVDPAMRTRYLSATPLGQQILKREGIKPTGAVTSLDILRAQGQVSRPEVIDRMLAGSPMGRQVLADRAKKARS